MVYRKGRLTISALVLLLLMSGCKKAGKSLEDDDLKTTSVMETMTNQTSVADREDSSRTSENLSSSESESEPDVVYVFDWDRLKRVIIDGKEVVEYEYDDTGLRLTKKGTDNCKFTYDENRNLIKEERNGKVITYFYEKDKEYEYWHIIGFNYEGRNYYYTRADVSRINGIQNENKELVAKYEYGSGKFKVSKVMKKQGEEWVCTDDSEFIGNVNKIRNGNDYYDEECDLYYGDNGVFYSPITGHVIMNKSNSLY